MAIKKSKMATITLTGGKLKGFVAKVVNKFEFYSSYSMEYDSYSVYLDESGDN